uniref:RNase NYN domain-containing protein n=1 Tax=Plectus sambesii TaxID=2011161 RepID=A0A914VL85_9BILA
MLGARSLIEDAMMVNGGSSRGINNSYIPDISALKPTADALPRKAVIDACNIGRAASGRGRKKVACDALLSLARHLLVRSFDVHLFIPIHYRTLTMDVVEHAAILEHLERLELLTFTTARRKTEERAAFQNYDDLFILGHAEQTGGFVLSGDHYDDVLRTKEFAHMRRVIVNRRVEPLWRDNFGKMFTRVGSDRFGRRIPDLVTSARYHYPGESLSDVFFCRAGDVDYEKVRQTVRSEEVRQKLIGEIDKIMDELESTGTVHSLALSNAARRLFPRSSSFPTVRSRAEFESSSQLDEREDNLNDLFCAANAHNLISPALQPSLDCSARAVLDCSTQSLPAYFSTPKEKGKKIEKKENERKSIVGSAKEDFTDRFREDIRGQLSEVFEEWVVEQAMEERQSVVDIALIANRCTEILDAVHC